MAGGIINIVTYGSEDLYLTGTPEISHFKVVYRRHTNFSMESMRVQFEDLVGFGEESSLIIPKIGDAIHKMYLEITVPEVRFPRSIDSEAIALQEERIQNWKDCFRMLEILIAVNFKAYRAAYNIFVSENGTYEEMIEAINNTFLNDTSIDTVEILNLTSLGLTNYDEIFDYVITCIKDFLNTPYCPFYCVPQVWSFMLDSLVLGDSEGEFLDESGYPSKRILMDRIEAAIGLENKLFHDFQVNIKKEEDKLADMKSTNYKFAWVKKLGHALIEHVSIYIAGDRIDRLYGDWINILYELTTSREKEEMYMKMIGNIPELITFDREIKPKTKLIIPLPFWFSKYNGLALPLVAMQYSDITVQVKFRNFQDVAYIEDYDNGNDINLDDMVEDMGYILNANLMMDYIYLDSPERKKFAQSSHEYLIDYTQEFFDEIEEQNEYTIRLDYSNTVKEIVWVLQRESYTQNINGYTQCDWFNYSISNLGSGNPMIWANMEMNGKIRLQKYGYEVFNYVYPYYFHTNTPSDGINIYSFGLDPEEHQPSGTCNFSRLNVVNLNLRINNNLLIKENTVDESERVLVRIYGLGYNILRFAGGFAALAFV